MHTLSSHVSHRRPVIDLRRGSRQVRAGALGRWVLSSIAAGLLAAPLGCGGASTTAPQPVALRGIAPNGGPIGGGTPVTIAGHGFRDGATVTIGGAPATSVRVTSGGAITAVAPAGRAVGGAHVVVTIPGGGRAELRWGDQYMPEVVQGGGGAEWDY